MYCPSCGEQAKPGLSYCTHCGVELNINKPNHKRGAHLPPAFLVAAMVATFLGGIGVITGLIAVMKASNLNEGVINGFAVMSFLMMVVIEALFIGLLLRSTLGKREKGERALTQRITNELDAPPRHALPAPAISITEHTTRTLEPTAQEPKAR